MRTTILAVLCLAILTPGASAQLALGPTKALHSSASIDSSSSDTTPFVGADTDGNFVVAWYSFYNLGGTIGTDSDIFAVSFSDPDSSDFTTQIVNSTAGSDGSASDDRPRLAVDGQGNWVAAWESFANIGGNGADNDIAFGRSTDDGATWATTENLSPAGLSDSVGDGRVRVAGDDDGNWVAVWRSTNDLGGTTGTDNDILFVRSTDGGATWGSTAALNTTAATDGSASDDVPVVATDGADNWVVVWQTNYNFGTSGTDQDIAVARSSDDGATWTAAARLNSDASSSFDDQDVQLATDRNGNWVCIWRSTNNIDGSNDYDVFYSRSTNNGATWSNVALLNHTATLDNSPASTDDQLSLAATPDGFLAAWRSTYAYLGSGTDTDIFFSVSATGASWGNVKIANDYAATDSGADQMPSAAGDDDGNWVLAWQGIENIGGSIGTDDDILFAKVTTAFTAPLVQSIVPVQNPANSSNAAFTVTFNQEVVNFNDDSDLAISESGITYSGVTITGGPAVYNVAINGITGEGTIEMAVETNTDIRSALGVDFTTTVNSPQLLIDNTGFTVNSITADIPSPSNADVLPFTVVFNEPVANFNDAGDLTVSAAGVSFTSASMTGGPTTYTVNFNGVTGDGTIDFRINGTSDVTDLAGNGLLSNTNSEMFTVDNTAPFVSSITPQFTSPTNDDDLEYTVQFSEDVTGFGEDDLLLSPVGLSFSGVSVSAGPMLYNLSIEDVGGDGQFEFSFDAGTDVEDLAGNPLGATLGSGNIEVDNTSPGFQDIVSTPATGYAGDTVSISFTSTEDLAADPVVLINGQPATPAAKDTAFNYEYTIAPTDPIGFAEINISGIDLAGNEGQATNGIALEILSLAPPVPVAAWPAFMALAAAGAMVLRRRK